VKLAPGQSKEITLTLNQLCLSVFNTDQNGWQLLPGEYNVTAGPSSSDTPLKATLHIHP
jgi:beta-glucosidase